MLLLRGSHAHTYLTVTERLNGSPGSVTTMSSPSGTRSDTGFSRLPLVCSNSGGGAWKNRGRPSEYASEGRLIWLQRSARSHIPHSWSTGTYNSCLSSIQVTSFSSVQSLPISAVALSPPHTGQSGRFSCSNVNVYRLSLPTY